MRELPSTATTFMNSSFTTTYDPALAAIEAADFTGNFVVASPMKPSYNKFSTVVGIFDTGSPVLWDVADVPAAPRCTLRTLPSSETELTRITSFSTPTYIPTDARMLLALTTMSESSVALRSEELLDKVTRSTTTVANAEWLVAVVNAKPLVMVARFAINPVTCMISMPT